MKKNRFLIKFPRGFSDLLIHPAGMFSLMILPVIIVIFAGSISHAVETSLNASIAPEKGTVGQTLTYTLSIAGIDPGTLKITLPEKKVVYPDKKPGEKNKNNKNSEGADGKPAEEFVPLYIINGATRDDSETNGTKQVNIKIIISYYRPGNYTLPEIKVAGKDGVSLGYKIPSVIIEETNKEGALEDIEPPLSLSGNYTRIILLIVLLLVILVLAAVLYRYYKKRKQVPPAEIPPLPPIEIFLNEVEALKLRELIHEGKINEYVFGISITFRRYLSSMLMFDAAEMTTDDIESEIKKYMPSDLYSICGAEIISNMRLWDFSKFAEFAPSAELLLENLDATISYAKKISGIVWSENGTAGI